MRLADTARVGITGEHGTWVWGIRDQGRKVVGEHKGAGVLGILLQV